MLLSIETSCDETALCLSKIDYSANSYKKTLENINEEVIASQIKLHKIYGGVVPELAAREHTKNLPLLFEQLVKDKSKLKAIAVTTGPGLKGCLLIGLSFAKAVAQSLKIPLIPVNHLEGHFFSGFLQTKEEQPEYPILTLLVSGGHTMLFVAKSPQDFELIAKTRDDAAGEAFDKGATLLGLPYPGGPSLSKRAELGQLGKFEFPVSMQKDDSSFSFSGLKTALSRKVEKTDKQDYNDLAASYQEAIVKSLLIKCIAAIKKNKPKSFLLTGGVAANQRLRDVLKEKIEEHDVKFVVTPRKWCTDNAAMISVVAQYKIGLEPQRYESFKYLDNSANSIGVDVENSITVKPRWPIFNSAFNLALD